MKKPRRPWTEEEIATLRRLRAEGETIARIAQALGRTPSGVQWKIEKLELPLGLRLTAANAKPASLCWDCGNYAVGCEWSESRGREPVPGWVTDIPWAGDLGHDRSYSVLECPKFRKG